MAKVTFANTKCCEAVTGDGKYQSHVTSAGVCDTDTLAADVAENLKDSGAYIATVLREAGVSARKFLKEGQRVVIDGVCRLEIAAEGSAPSEDTPWNPDENRLVVNAIANAAIRDAAKDIIPENVLKPVAIQLLGAQDQTTLEQNAVVKGNVLLLQGKGVKITAANADEGVFVVKGTDEHKLAVTESTQGTVDCTVPEDVPADRYDRIEVRGRAGNGTNRMLVTASITGFEIKAA